MIFPPLIHNSFQKKLKPAFDLGPFLRPESDRSPEQSKVAAACPPITLTSARKIRINEFLPPSTGSPRSARFRPETRQSEQGEKSEAPAPSNQSRALADGPRPEARRRTIFRPAAIGLTRPTPLSSSVAK